MLLNSCCPGRHSYHFSERGKAAARVALAAFSMGVGFTIAYPGSIPEWSDPKIAITNIGVIGAYGMIGTWGIYMFGDKVIPNLLKNETSMSLLKVARQVIHCIASLGLGFFSQIPIGMIAFKYHGLWWGVATQLGGLWPASYSQHVLMDLGAKQIQKSPHLSLNKQKKMQRRLSNSLKKTLGHAALHSRLMSQDEREQNYRNWTLNKVSSHENVRIQSLFQDIISLSESFLQPQKEAYRGKHLLKNSCQIAATCFSIFYFWQNVLLARDFWMDTTDNEALSYIFAFLTIIPMIYYTIKSTTTSTAHLLDQVTNPFGKIDKSITELAFPKISKALYGLSLVIAALPQIQTLKIAEGYYQADTPFGITFSASNILGTSLFVYLAMKEMFEALMEQAIEFGFAGEHFSAAKKLEEDLNHYLETLEHRTLADLVSHVHQIPHGEIRDKLLKEIDLEVLEEVLEIIPV